MSQVLVTGVANLLELCHCDRLMASGHDVHCRVAAFFAELGHQDIVRQSNAPAEIQLIP
jgi:hypothetical protein